ncbi:triose-phosphate isomerase [Actinomyces sp. zg-332]|uniref:triose-phosphate isomerase n=1 Tax=Actinomyces sp. zg-332 TaxID=2708340 RepID=UPI001423A697|nr:triose-phosphate isomerase [Actinomyces sp. zg-332]QPK93755.1 triose-phosphate isomerase [Actinomyces sp. zg-332]
MRTPLIAGNWKMNMNHLEAIQLVSEIGNNIKDLGTLKTEVLIVPPFTDIRSVQTVIDSDGFEIKYGAQDVSAHSGTGAYTGEISAQMLKTLKCEYVLVGHSERREYHNESDQLVGTKAQVILDNGMKPILCCGEPLQVRRAGQHVEYVLEQLKGAFAEINSDDISKIVIAYEPIWAIGTGEVATAEDAQEVCAAIRSYLEKEYGEEVASVVRVLYGGSVKSSTIKELMAQSDVDGALIGGASLKAEEFVTIASYNL